MFSGIDFAVGAKAEARAAGCYGSTVIKFRHFTGSYAADEFTANSAEVRYLGIAEVWEFGQGDFDAAFVGVTSTEAVGGVGAEGAAGTSRAEMEQQLRGTPQV